jgi:hypothetical protein
MSFLPFTKYKNNERTVSGTVDVENSDVILNVDTTLVAATIYLKSIPADYWSTLYKLYIKDINGNAAINNITIIAPTGYLINNAQQIVIDVNGGGAVIRIQDNYDYNASLNYCCGGGGLFFDLLNSQLLNLIATNQIIAGAYYNVTDAIYADEGVVLLGINQNEVSLQGEGKYLNADYQAVGNYSGVSGFVANLGIWTSVNQPVCVIGDVVIWNNSHYVNLTGNYGSTPETDTTNWLLLAKSVTNGYIQETDFVKYDHNNNIVIYRADSRLNEVDLFIDTKGNTSLILFQWGRNVVIGNKLRGQSIFFTTNSYCFFNSNMLSNGILIDYTPNIPSVNGYYYNTIESYSSWGIDNSGTSNIAYNVLQNGSSAYFTTLIASTISNNYMNNASNLRIAIMDSSSLRYNSIINGSSLTGVGNIMTIATIESTIIENQGFLEFDNLTSTNIEKCKVSANNVILYTQNSVSFVKKVIEVNYSNWEGTLDFGDSSIFNGTDLTIPTTLFHCGIFTIIGSSALLPVYKIFQMATNHPCIFKPNNTLQCGFQHTLVSLSVAGDLLCDAPASLNIITGRTDGTDFIQYQQSGTKLIRINLVLLA